MKKIARILVVTTGALLSLAAPIGGYALYTIATDNFHDVAKGQVFRSAQLDKDELAAAIRGHGIRSVLNLRGKNAGTSWYDEEIGVCRLNGVAHCHVPLSAGKDVSSERMDVLVQILRTAPKPLLLHCKSGADRAAFASALYHLAVEGEPAVLADDELTIWYGHIPMITPHVAAMDRSFSAYTECHPVPAVVPKG